MKTTTAAVFEPTIQKSQAWLKELQSDLPADNAQDAYRALRSVLIALRDRTTVEEATDLGSQLPMLIRGCYYESWNPSKTPRKARTRDEFLGHVGDLLKDNPNIDPLRATRSVFGLLRKRITAGEISDIRANLPQALQGLWNQE